MKTSNKVQNAKGRVTRGELPGDKKVNRTKRSAAGVTFIPEGKTLLDEIRNDRATSRPVPAPRTHNSKPSANGERLQKQQAARAYSSLNLVSGTFEAKVSAAFTKAWLAASPDKSKGETRTGLAVKATKEILVSEGHATSEQLSSRQVRDLLNNAVRAIKDAFVPIG
jgi:hypothetical protein